MKLEWNLYGDESFITDNILASKELLYLHGIITASNLT